MKFFTNRIPTGKPKTFAELISEQQASKQQKQASSSKVVKTAEAKASEPDEAESSGQLDVEPLHQEGESTPSPGKKEEGKKEASGVMDTDNENAQGAEGDDSGQPKAEEKCHNDPEAGKHRDGDGDQKQAKAEGKTKKAEAKEEDEEDSKSESKEAAGIDNFGDKKAEPFGKKDDKDEDKDDDKEASKKSETKEAACTCGKEDCEECGCKASAEATNKKAAGIKYYKIADLNEKSKSVFKEYWKQLWPDDFVDAVSADK